MILAERNGYKVYLSKRKLKKTLRKHRAGNCRKQAPGAKRTRKEIGVLVQEVWKRSSVESGRAEE